MSTLHERYRITFYDPIVNRMTDLEFDYMANVIANLANSLPDSRVV